MAAGDVVIKAHTRRSVRGFRFVAGEVTLDGGNPTPVDLGDYMRECLGGVVTLKATATPGDDPVSFSVGVSGDTLNVYAYKHDGTDPTLVASTNNAAVVSFIAWGLP